MDTQALASKFEWLVQSAKARCAECGAGQVPIRVPCGDGAKWLHAPQLGGPVPQTGAAFGSECLVGDLYDQMQRIRDELGRAGK